MVSSTPQDRETQDLFVRAESIYETRLKAVLELSHRNPFVAVEPESGDYFVAPTMGEAGELARRRYPDRRCGLFRVGHRAAVQMGSAIRQ